MDPLWTLMEPLWTPYGPPMDPLWTPYGPLGGPAVVQAFDEEGNPVLDVACERAVSWTRSLMWRVRGPSMMDPVLDVACERAVDDGPGR